MTKTGFITSAEAAEQLEVSQSAIQRWYKLGILSGKHSSGQSQLWIYWTDDIAYRLKGSAIPDVCMVSVRSLCRTQGMRPDEVLAWAQQTGHQIYRLRRGKTLRFFILPAEA